MNAGSFKSHRWQRMGLLALFAVVAALTGGAQAFAPAHAAALQTGECFDPNTDAVVFCQEDDGGGSSETGGEPDPDPSSADPGIDTGTSGATDEHAGGDAVNPQPSTYPYTVPIWVPTDEWTEGHLSFWYERCVWVQEELDEMRENLRNGGSGRRWIASKETRLKVYKRAWQKNHCEDMYDGVGW